MISCINSTCGLRTTKLYWLCCNITAEATIIIQSVVCTACVLCQMPMKVIVITERMFHIPEGRVIDDHKLFNLYILYI